VRTAIRQLEAGDIIGTYTAVLCDRNRQISEYLFGERIVEIGRHNELPCRKTEGAWGSLDSGRWINTLHKFFYRFPYQFFYRDVSLMSGIS
jgi:hypothetical protein